MRQETNRLRTEGLGQTDKLYVVTLEVKAAPAPQSDMSVQSNARNELIHSCSLRRQKCCVFCFHLC